MRAILVLVVIACTITSAVAQQVADTLFNPPVANPAYARQTGPVVFIDEAHTNFHTLKGRFRPFASVLEKDGYVVKASATPFTREHLAGARILVIANALHADNEARWSLPVKPAFTPAEVEAVTDWVRAGGALFLIADHMPFPGAAENLAAAFGFTFYNGFAIRKGSGKDIFTPDSGLADCALTRGRNDQERVSSVQTFTGQAFSIPAEAKAVITLSSRYELKMPEEAWKFNKTTRTLSAEGFAQGAMRTFGEGRVLVFGEAAMFTAQRSGNSEMGMNARSASQNVQFLLNAMHWLDGTLK